MGVLYALESIRTPALDKIMSVITLLGGELFFMVIAVTVFWCVSKREGYYLMIVGFFGTVINQFLKILCCVPRPWIKDPDFTIVESARAEATGYSFPSGHTQNAVATYGGMARHGGGAFSGKDPSKVDRSAAYAARYVAKNIVAAGLADRCEIQVSYAIGVAEPTSIMVETFGTEKVPSEQLTLLVREFFDLRPYGLIQMLDLLHPIYKETAAYGHFGREHFPWEKTDKAQLLRDAAGLK